MAIISETDMLDYTPKPSLFQSRFQMSMPKESVLVVSEVFNTRIFHSMLPNYLKKHQPVILQECNSLDLNLQNF